MGLTRKRRSRKRYRYISRKRINKQSKKTPKIGCEPVKDEWNDKASVRKNLSEMGLSHDPNVTLPIPNSILKPLFPKKNESMEVQRVPSKGHVAQALEDDARAPREKLFRLPKSQVDWLTYLLDKYGEDYKAMERDEKNYYQETWRQLRGKMKVFKKIPEQYEAYLNSKKQSVA